MSGAVKRSAFDSAKARVKLYVIWNGYIYPDYAEVEDDVASIAQHSLDAAMDSAGLGEVRRIYHFMKERDWSYNLAFIPDDFRPEEKEAFDPYLMKRLFDKGYADASSGYDWHKSPPA
jgi:pyoverdine/dityrosine biosynthesis protein Dit1